MGMRDPRVDAYIERAEPFARPILEHLRAVVHAGCPDVEETMKWNFPRLNTEGVKTPRTARRRKPVPRTPADLAAALRHHRRARATFEALRPSHRREYVEWITEAKRPETRKRRVETTVAWLAEGRSRNWKYTRTR